MIIIECKLVILFVENLISPIVYEILSSDILKIDYIYMVLSA